MRSTSKVVDSFFSNVSDGKFLEIGAAIGDPNDPEEPFWNLLVGGWYGLYCEPDYNGIGALMDNVSPYKSDILMAPVWKERDLKEFYSSRSHPYTSSFDANWHIGGIPIYKKHIPFESKKIYVSPVTPKDIFDKFGWDFNAISIDIELSEDSTYEFLESIDFHKLSDCKLVVMEVVNENIKRYLDSFGFNFHFSGFNHIWVR